MTISAITASKQYTGTGADTALPTVFAFFVSSDIIVTQRMSATGVDTVMVLGTHYTVSGGSAAGATGTVTPISGAVNFTTGMTWKLDRSIPLTQELDYVENDVFPAASHESGLDRLTMQSQDREARLDRTLRFPAGDSESVTGELPDSVTRASKALTFDSSGNAVATDPVSASGTTVTATGSTEARTLAERFGEFDNVKDWGATGDGVTNDTASFQAAVTAITGTEGTIFIPEGDYVVNLYSLTYGSKAIRWMLHDAATTTNVDAPQCYIFPAGAVFGSEYSVDITPSTTDHTDIYRAFGENRATSEASLFGFHFDLIGHGAGEAVRGLIGTVTNASDGSGLTKGIRIKAKDLNVTTGAGALAAISADVEPTAVTTNAMICELVNAGPTGSDDVVDAIIIKTEPTGTNPRWKSGIVFQQGDEYEDAVIQASMGSGSGASARFLKLKDAAGTTVTFEVLKDGEVRAVELHGGLSTTNGIKIDTAAIQRTAAAGNLVIGSGATSGTFELQASGATQLEIVSDGIILPTGKELRFGSASGPGSFSGSGTPEGAVTAPVGSIFHRSDGGAGTSFYVKETGTGNTGWVGK